MPLCMYEGGSWSFAYHTNKIFPKRSKKAKMCQRSYSSVPNDLLNN